MTRHTIVPLTALVLFACAETPLEYAGVDVTPSANHETDRQSAVAPQPVPGNFVAEDDQQLCYAIYENFVGGGTGFLDGLDLIGIKIDPVGANLNVGFGGFTVTSTSDGQYVNWAAEDGTTVLAAVIKGGNAFNLYDYQSAGLTTLTSDVWLHSPLKASKKGFILPEISHVNFCIAQDVADEGCTPGYWRNHADRWTGVTPADDFDTTFGVDAFAPNITLGAAIQLGGGGLNALARHATAALLNAHGGVPNTDGNVVDYPYTAAEVIQMVQDAIADGTGEAVEAAKDLLDTANNLGCPLSGTEANPVA